MTRSFFDQNSERVLDMFFIEEIRKETATAEFAQRTLLSGSLPLKLFHYYLIHTQPL